MTCFDRMQRGVLFLICALAMTVAHASAAGAEDKTSPAAATAVKDAAQKGFPLTSSSTDVTGNISVEAVLIPAKIAKTVFGKEVSNNYAVIALTISNRSSDEAFIVHSIFIDYSQWLLSGGSPNPQQSNGNPLQPYQQQSQRNQIDSVETRIVRGELLDRQPWTTRNWVLRALQSAGSIATGFTFVTSSQSWIRGIGAFNGSGIPAAQTLWPDATVGQMNRISDFGFQVNKVIAKQSSDIVVAFFPIDRFLTPDLASLFVSSPSVFFAPMAALADPKVSSRIEPYIYFVLGEKPTAEEAIKNLMSHIHEVHRDGCAPPNPDAPPVDPNLERACRTADLVDRLSLNVVSVRVGGTMTVDVNKVPPQITEVDIDTRSAKDAASMWAKGANLTGVIRGSFLGGGTPIVTNLDSKVLQIKAVAEGSIDTELHFTITLNDNLPAGTNKLSFQVTKKPDGSTTTSATRDYTIDVNKVPPQITEVSIDTPAGKDAKSMWTKGTNLTGVLRGSFLGSGTPTVTNIDSKVLEVKGITEGSNDTELHLAITLDAELPAGTNKLSFQVTKKSDGSTLTSASYDYTIQTAPQPNAGAGAASGGTHGASGSTPGEKPQTGASAGASKPPKPPKK